MKVQHENILIENQTAVSQEPMMEYGFIATSMGSGLADIFKDFGVDYIIEGGQTMNPSTEDFMKAIDSINAENIIIVAFLPIFDAIGGFTKLAIRLPIANADKNPPATL